MQGVLPYQSLLNKEAEENGIAHFSEALEHISLQLCILNDVLQLVVEKLQDALKDKEGQSEKWEPKPPPVTWIKGQSMPSVSYIMNCKPWLLNG